MKRQCEYDNSSSEHRLPKLFTPTRAGSPQLHKLIVSQTLHDPILRTDPSKSALTVKTPSGTHSQRAHKTPKTPKIETQTTGCEGWGAFLSTTRARPGGPGSQTHNIHIHFFPPPERETATLTPFPARDIVIPVSYTHLTLPTTTSV